MCRTHHVLSLLRGGRGCGSSRPRYVDGDVGLMYQGTALELADRCLELSNPRLQLRLPSMQRIHLDAQTHDRPVEVTADLAHELHHKLLCLVIHGETPLFVSSGLDDGLVGWGQIGS